MQEYIVLEVLEAEIAAMQGGKIVKFFELLTSSSPNFPPFRLQCLSKDKLVFKTSHLKFTYY